MIRGDVLGLTGTKIKRRSLVVATAFASCAERLAAVFVLLPVVTCTVVERRASVMIKIADDFARGIPEPLTSCACERPYP